MLDWKKSKEENSINQGIKILKDNLKNYGFKYYMSKSDVLLQSVKLIEEMDKQIDISSIENNLLNLIYLYQKHDWENQA